MSDPSNYDGQGKSREQDERGAQMIFVWAALALAVWLVVGVAVYVWVF